MRAAALVLCAGCSLITATDPKNLDGDTADSGTPDSAPDTSGTPLSCKSPGTLIAGTTSTIDTTPLDDLHEPECRVGDSSAPDAVFELTLDDASDVQLSTFGSDFNTVLSLRTACKDGSTDVLCANDANDLGTTKIVARNLSAGTYYVVADGDGREASGSLELVATVTAAAGQRTCDNPIDISGGASIAGATAGSDDNGSGCGGAGAPEEVYRLTLDSAAQVIVHTVGSAFNTVIYIRRNDCESGTVVECDDNSAQGTQSRIQAELLPGTYYIFVDGSLGQSGEYRMVVYVNDRR